MIGKIVVILITACMFILTACPKNVEFTGKDAEMMKAAKQIAELIDEQFSDTSEYPDSLAQLRQMVPVGKIWPVNPYDGKEIADTFSRDFDPEKSVGMVYYEKIFRDEQQVNYNLHVFGDKGKLYIIGNTAMGVKE
jgi:hypothetical protein